MTDGTNAAHAALTLIGLALNTNPELTLDQLTADLEHINLDKNQARRALALIAAQVWSERRISDAARARDTEAAMNMIASQVDWLRNRHKEP